MDSFSQGQYFLPLLAKGVSKDIGRLKVTSPIDGTRCEGERGSVTANFYKLYI